MSSIALLLLCSAVHHANLNNQWNEGLLIHYELHCVLRWEYSIMVGRVGKSAGFGFRAYSLQYGGGGVLEWQPLFYATCIRNFWEWEVLMSICCNT
jgi:hypothetical protein